MNAPGLPKDEEARLRALKSLDILDTPAEERFDRLTRLAKRMFDVPIALVSLVDGNRQWFKSSMGLDVRETPRDISFCGHAILGDEVFYIPDTKKDERFTDNPLVTGEPKIRFYAGCPLRSLTGSKHGTLCIIDKKPRILNSDDQNILRDLALTVERELAAVHLATLDELTSLFNRRGFTLQASSSINLCVRQSIPISLVFMDLNKFKTINDRFGHAEGDRALFNFAAQLREHSRASDILARWSGDEFVMMLPNSSKEQAEGAIYRFKKALKKRSQYENWGYELEFSHGIVEYEPGRHEAVEELLAEGDAMMYRRKHNGLNPQHFEFEPAASSR